VIEITERNRLTTALGDALLIKVFEPGYRALGWREVWDAFSARYPDKWAVQVFPPADQLVDGKSVYHLFVLDKPPAGLNIRTEGA
jgi:hypothetical protein